LPKAAPISESPEDYFLSAIEGGQGDELGAGSSNRELPDLEPESSGSTLVAEDALNRRESDGRPRFGHRVETAEGVEDGDDSGEEKISSAVFLPHQRLQEAPEAPVSRPPRLVPVARTKSRAGDFHPWLVKADDPEVDSQATVHDDFDAHAKLKLEDSSAPLREPSSRAIEEPVVILDEHEPGPYQHYEDHVHGHQLTPKQPLEAIELIPYKHQVGGHTTLWRFSKRAVCKQLNNRENEFYETVEKYHRDLLAFLPRYVAPWQLMRRWPPHFN